MKPYSICKIVVCDLANGCCIQFPEIGEYTKSMEPNCQECEIFLFNGEMEEEISNYDGEEIILVEGNQ